MLGYLCYVSLGLLYIFCGCPGFYFCLLSIRDLLGRASPKLPILRRVGRKTLTQSTSTPSLFLTS